jgi:hypothetical protein
MSEQKNEQLVQVFLIYDNFQADFPGALALLAPSR